MIAASKAMREGARIAPDRSCAEFIEAVAAVNEGIVDPVDKLHYVRTSLNLHPESERALRFVPSGAVRRWLARMMSALALQRCTRTGAIPVGQRIPLEVLDIAVRTRRMAMLSVAVVSVALIVGTLRMLPSLSQSSLPTRAVINRHPVPSVAISSPAPIAAPVVPHAAAPAAEFIAPPSPQELTANIWLVDKGDTWELYSNGLRIETAFETDATSRRFVVFEKDQTEPVATESSPVGILMHTSESDVWPFEATFNTNIRDSSRALLRYVKRLQLYNYVIDRFGRVYRVVRDASSANHAGRGVWSHDDRYYLNLNSAMLGVCFETRWNGGNALPITEAQLLAGRNLTAYLRQRYSIAPDMVAAHGITSVNAKSHLIGHHLDWARGFPFEAFGLPNQYERPPPSVAIFGFAYDAKFLEAVGQPWPGLRQAELALAAQARALGISTTELRARKQAQFDAWLQRQSRDAGAAAATKDPHTAAQAASKS